MKVRDFMSRRIVTVSSSTSLPQVWKLLFQNHIHCLPVVDQKKRVIGMISKEDFLRKLFPDYGDVVPDFSAGEDFEDDIKTKLEKLKKWTAERVMSRRVIFTREETNIMRALSRMIVQKVRQLPVVDDDEHVVGMVSKGDIFKGLFRKSRASSQKSSQTHVSR